MRSVRPFALCAVALVLFVSPQRAYAQASPYTVDDIADLIVGGIPEDAITVRALAKCLNFHLTAAVTERFRSLGATNALIKGLGKVCYDGPGQQTKPKVKPAITTKTVIAPAAI